MLELAARWDEALALHAKRVRSERERELDPVSLRTEAEELVARAARGGAQMIRIERGSMSDPTGSLKNPPVGAAPAK